MRSQTDIEARYLASIVDLIAAEAHDGAAAPRICALANSAAHLARRIADSSEGPAPQMLPAIGCEGESNVIPFRRPS